MLSTKTMKPNIRAEVDKLAESEGTRAAARFMWALIDPGIARKNLGKIRDAAMFKKITV